MYDDIYLCLFMSIYKHIKNIADMVLLMIHQLVVVKDLVMFAVQVINFGQKLVDVVCLQCAKNIELVEFFLLYLNVFYC